MNHQSREGIRREPQLGGRRQGGEKRRPGLQLQLRGAVRDESSFLGWTHLSLSHCLTRNTARLRKTPQQSSHPPCSHLDASPTFSLTVMPCRAISGTACKGLAATAIRAAWGFWPSRLGSPLAVCVTEPPVPGTVPQPRAGLLGLL